MASTIWFCIVVQWENENTVSVVNEKQVVGDVELTEGIIVDVYRLVSQDQRKIGYLQSDDFESFW